MPLRGLTYNIPTLGDWEEGRGLTGAGCGSCKGRLRTCTEAEEAV